MLCIKPFPHICDFELNKRGLKMLDRFYLNAEITFAYAQQINDMAIEEYGILHTPLIILTNNKTNNKANLHSQQINDMTKEEYGIS